MSNTPNLLDWIGREDIRDDVIGLREAQLLAAALDRETAPTLGSALPFLWHWCAFVPIVRARETGADGHPKRGGFMPPVQLPRRMWAGGQLTFHTPLPIGAAAKRTSRIASITEKSGNSGSLVFVTVQHHIMGAHGLAIEEQQDVVYRAAPAIGAVAVTPPAAPCDAHWSDTMQADPVLLFRYSALTFNSHRIHYDAPYARDAEHYSGLVVHGPLIATLLAESLCKRTTRAWKRFSFRAVSPLFDHTAFTLNGTLQGYTARLWAANADGGLAMSAEVTLATE